MSVSPGLHFSLQKYEDIDAVVHAKAIAPAATATAGAAAATAGETSAVALSDFAVHFPIVSLLLTFA